MKTDTIDFSEFRLCCLEADSFFDVPNSERDAYYRVEIPFNPNNAIEMAKKGYVFVDRTLGVSVSLRKNEIDYKKMIRFDVRKASQDYESVLSIALNSFPNDRRFHIRPKPDNDVSSVIIRKWVDNLSDIYVCLHKDKVVGFLDLEPYDETGKFIHLAAVHERYRAAGAAVSLYAYVITKMIEDGYEKVYGRISSANTAVMNLYTRLGGTFADPIDVFVRNEDES